MMCFRDCFRRLSSCADVRFLPHPWCRCNFHFVQMFIAISARFLPVAIHVSRPFTHPNISIAQRGHRISSGDADAVFSSQDKLYEFACAGKNSPVESFFIYTSLVRLVELMADI
jgi:hypothetical protein